MESTILSSLDNLTHLGLRSGVDMRPTLLRVLTDLYVQKLTHTPEEERHYTELALRLLDAVDVATRVDGSRPAVASSVAARCASSSASRRICPTSRRSLRDHPVLTRRDRSKRADRAGHADCRSP